MLGGCAAVVTPAPSYPCEDSETFARLPTHHYNPATMRAVIDTNVVFEGLTKQTSLSNIIIRAWQTDLFEACYSIPLGYEYQDVLGRKLSKKRWEIIKDTLDELLLLATPITIKSRWRPISPDPDDDFVIECAMNAGAIVVTYNIRDFRLAEQKYGLEVMKPDDFLAELFK